MESDRQSGRASGCPLCRSPILPDAGRWVAHVDEHGESYFLEVANGTWTYVRPAASVGHWHGRRDARGRKYWLNKLTGEKTWEQPEELKTGAGGAGAGVGGSTMVEI